MFGLPNAPKQNFPLRPILAAFSQHSLCNLAKFLVYILDPFTRNEFSVQNYVSLSALLQTPTQRDHPHCYL